MGKRITMKKKNIPAETYIRKLEDPPLRLVTDGIIRFGTFSSRIPDVNLKDARRPFGFPMPRALKGLRLKEWQAFQLGNERYFILVVLYNQKVGCLTQVIWNDRVTGQSHKYEKIGAPWKLTNPATIDNSRLCFESKGYRIDFHNMPGTGRIYIDIAIDAHKNRDGFYGRFEALHDDPSVHPICVSLPLGSNRGMYSYKCLMTMRGFMYTGGSRIDFSPEDSFAVMDDHKGYYPYRLRYDWVTGARVEKRGPVGFNLTDNQVIGKDEYNENCLWEPDRLTLLPPVTFERPDGVYGDWLIKDTCGIVDLKFTPVMKNEIHNNYLAIYTDYYGPFGVISGTIRNSAGKAVSIKQFPAMGEKKYLRG
jgi:hypothetical protein